VICRGDHVIVARLDRLSRSFIGIAHILDAWVKLKVVLHLCDMPGGVFDPENPMSEMMIGILIVFANYERRLISQRTKEGLAARRQGARSIAAGRSTAGGGRSAGIPARESSSASGLRTIRSGRSCGRRSS